MYTRPIVHQLLLVLLLSTITSHAEDRIHFWIKAFIPNAHPTNPGYIRPVPGDAGKTMIPGPTGSECVVTNKSLFKLPASIHSPRQGSAQGSTTVLT